jgi:hypothetical protein
MSCHSCVGWMRSLKSKLSKILGSDGGQLPFVFGQGILPTSKITFCMKTSRMAQKYIHWDVDIGDLRVIIFQVFIHMWILGDHSSDMIALRKRR